MKSIITIGAVAAIAFTVGSVMTAGGSQVNPNVSRQMTPMMIASCATGFTKGSYPGSSAPNYECKTPVIKCPEIQGMLSFTEAQPVANSPQGIRFAYRCTYQKPPG